MSPLISVIVPVYNAEQSLKRCIDSVLRQSYLNWELLLIDDGSVDSSGKICNDYATKYDNVKAFHKNNGGVSSARNVGLDQAVVEWITFLDSDDYIDVNFLSSFVKLESSDLSIAGIQFITGFIISMAYLGYAIFFKKEQKENAIAFGKYFLIILTVILPVLMTLYYADDTFYKNIRFAFEGFFNWWEQGEYKNRSNSILLHMIVWPDNWQDWLLGEGYFAQPNLVDPYYIGPRYEGFYKGTDIGYCLFIFYFGLIGLACMIAYIVKAAFCGMERFPMYKGMFFMILAINLIGWCKVSTDIFPIFAPFLIIPAVSIQKNELN